MHLNYFRKFGLTRQNNKIILYVSKILFKGMSANDTQHRINDFVKKNDLILEIGARTSPDTKYLQNIIISIDLLPTLVIGSQHEMFGFSKEAVTDIKKDRFRKSEVIMVYANAENLPFRDKCFDKILLTEVIEHIHNDTKAVIEMARVLEKSGSIFLTTPNLETVPLNEGLKEHIRHYSGNTLRKLFEPYFEKIHIERRFYCSKLLLKANKIYPINNDGVVVKFILPYLALFIVFNIICFFEKYFSKNGSIYGGYSLVAEISRPKLDIDYQV
ncbi:MAG: class I SAM-dependent methyltransferase [Candidatus Omnitrophota bacterium]|nr:class I SAM-dependent methyltransferase [Candidatus Omnitrophota bacterium]